MENIQITISRSSVRPASVVEPIILNKMKVILLMNSQTTFIGETVARPARQFGHAISNISVFLDCGKN